MDQQQNMVGHEPAAQASTTPLALAVADGDGLEAELEVELDVEDGKAMLRDAAAVLAARRRLDALLAQLAAQPFSASAYSGLRAYLAGPADRALAAYQRVCAATATRGT